ncbi:MAG TPA: hypothetical protein VIG62_01525 [Blastocatellia bacterium]
MEARSIKVNCPECASGEVVYTCEPECCFNHVCNDCLASFLLVTYETGGRASAPVEVRQPDSCEPTVACAACGSLKVGALADEAGGATLVCGACRSLLRLGFSRDGGAD